MANSKSAKKHIKTSKRNRFQNRKYKLDIKNTNKRFMFNLKEFEINSNLSNKIRTRKSLNQICSSLNKACKRNILHKNKVKRKMSQLVRSFNKNLL